MRATPKKGAEFCRFFIILAHISDIQSFHYFSKPRLNIQNVYPF